MISKPISVTALSPNRSASRARPTPQDVVLDVVERRPMSHVVATHLRDGIDARQTMAKALARKLLIQLEGYLAEALASAVTLNEEALLEVLEAHARVQVGHIRRPGWRAITISFEE